MCDLASVVKFMSDKQIKRISQLSSFKKLKPSLIRWMSFNIDNANLPVKVSALRFKVHSLQWYILEKNNIKINRIPVSVRENITDLVKDGGAALRLRTRTSLQPTESYLSRRSARCAVYQRGRWRTMWPASSETISPTSRLGYYSLPSHLCISKPEHFC